jgi:regulator of protease activity HflC (stomatin/prohibitin superfamily)
MMADEPMEKDQKPQQHATGAEKMHKFASEQIEHFKKVNKAEREKKAAEAKKHAEELKAKAEKQGQKPIPPGEADVPSAPESDKPKPSV